MSENDPDLARRHFAALMQKAREIARRVTERVDAVRQQFTSSGESQRPEQAAADGLSCNADDGTACEGASAG